MKLPQILPIIKQELIRSFLFASFLTLFMVAYALAVSYPTTTPTGEVSGGRFGDVLNKVLQSNNYKTDTTGQVKDVAMLNGIAASGYQLSIVTTACPANQGIQSVGAAGGITCN